MPAPILKTSPTTKRELRNLGKRIRTARLLRRLPMDLLAERAGTTRATLHRVERGDPSVRVGIYAMALQGLGLIRGFGDVEDPLGDMLAEELLPKRIRKSRP